MGEGCGETSPASVPTEGCGLSVRTEGYGKIYINIRVLSLFTPMGLLEPLVPAEP
jgi:hypothetical protein